jgi:hypothetical protein
MKDIAARLETLLLPGIVCLVLSVALTTGTARSQNAMLASGPGGDDLGVLTENTALHDFTQPDPGNQGNLQVLSWMWVMMMIVILAIPVVWIVYKIKDGQA